MNSAVNSHRNTDGKKPTSSWLLLSPLDYIAEDHMRLRAMCAEIDLLADETDPDCDALSTLIDYLKEELPLLLADEHEDLIPRVAACAAPEDELPKLARRLKREHDKIADLLGVVLDGLLALTPAQTIPAELGLAMHDFARATRRHLILENAVLLPLSRARLTAFDLGALRTAMFQRRGLKDLNTW